MRTIEFGVGDATLVRFGTSAMWEVICSLRVLREPANHAVHLPWVRRVEPAVRALSSAASERDRANLRLLADVVGSSTQRHYVPDFLTPPPSTPVASIEDELERILRTPLPDVRDQLGHLRARWTPGLQALHDDPTRLTGLVDQILRYWETALAPHWSGITAVNDAEIFLRGQQLASEGTAAMLRDLHDRVSWNGSELRVGGTRCIGTRVLDGGGLCLVPSVFAWPSVMVVADGRTAQLAFPSRGAATLWAGEHLSRPALERVLGRPKARVIAALDAPLSTTAVAREVGLSVSSVSEHLAALRDAGLVMTRRIGRSTLNTRTALGDALLAGGATG